MWKSVWQDTLWNASTADSLVYLFVIAVIVSLFWLGCFYAACWTHRWWGASLPASPKQHENSVYWAAWYVLGSVHAIVVASVCVPAVFILWTAPVAVQFASTPDLATCAFTEGDPSFAAVSESNMHFLIGAVAFAGLLFTSFVLVDLIVVLRHGLAGWDYTIHHIIFIAAGWMIRGHCMLPFNAAILMAMEVSTPFLNYHIFFRKRPGYEGSRGVKLCQYAFAATFFPFRLLINTYGAYHFWAEFSRAMPQAVPLYQRWFLLIMLIAGAAIQFFWAYKIIVSLITPEKDDGDDAEKQPLKEKGTP